MSAWQGTKLENLLAGLGRDTIIVTGAWTNMSIEHTSRTGADKGFVMVVPEDGCSTMNAEWHNASINFALQNVSTVTSCADVKAALADLQAADPRADPYDPLARIPSAQDLNAAAFAAADPVAAS